MDIAIFDFDGVLIDSKAGYVSSLIDAAKSFSITGLSSDELALRMNFPMDSQLQYILGNTHTTEREDALLACFRRVCLEEPAFGVTTFPGVFDMLNHLTDTGLVLGLCTNKPHDLARVVLRELELDQFFTFVYGGDAGVKRKPAPDMIYAILNDSGVATSRAVLIGDSVSDIEAAKNACISSVAVSWGYTSRDRLIAAEPDHVFDDCGEIVSYFTEASL